MHPRTNARTTVVVDAEEGRRRREDDMVQFRRIQCGESMLKKRRQGPQATQLPQFDPSSLAAAAFSSVERKLEALPSMVTGVWSEDINSQLETTTQFRKLLSMESNLPIDEVIRAGVVPR